MPPQTKYIRYVPRAATMKRIGKLHVQIYRLTGGLLGKRMDGLDILLLTTRGRKTGRLRTVPLPYFRDGSNYVLLASFGGNPKNPAWFGNLRAHPEVALQVGFQRMTARARITEGEERQRLWQQITYAFPRYLAYQKKTERLIPIIVLECL